MAATCCEAPAKLNLWPAYRSAFAEFARRLRRLQSLAPRLGPEALLRASLDVEEARLRYNSRRDALARQFLPWWPAADTHRPQSARV